MSARLSHAARVESSPRLRALLTALLKAGERGLTTREIQDRTDACAVHSDVDELRDNGYRIPCVQEKSTASGRRVFRYRLLGKLAEPSKTEGVDLRPSPQPELFEEGNA